MGSTNFVNQIVALSPQDGFKILRDYAVEEYGNDRYNGTISTCSMGRLKKSYAKYSERNEKLAYGLIEDDNYGRKHSADYIDLGVVEYQVITLKKETVKSKQPVIRTKYTVKASKWDNFSISTSSIVKYFDTKKEADDYALKLALRDNKEYEVHKEGIVIEGDTLQTRIVQEVKSYKTKPSLKPMPNRKILEYHKYLFYGWASE